MDLEELTNLPYLWHSPSLHGIHLTVIFADITDICPNSLMMWGNNKPIIIGVKAAAFMFTVCEHENFCSRTKFQSIALYQCFLSKYSEEISMETKKLYSLISVFVASKLNESTPMNSEGFHRISNHSYRNEELQKAEKEFLKVLDYEVDSLDNMIYDKLSLALFILRPLIPSSMYSVCYNMTIRLLSIVYSSEKILTSYNNGQICCGVIQAAINMCSRSKEVYPVTTKMSHLFDVSYEDITIVSKKVIKLAFPESCKTYHL